MVAQNCSFSTLILSCSKKMLYHFSVGETYRSRHIECSSIMEWLGKSCCVFTVWCCLANNTNNCEESHYKEIRLSIRWSGMEVFFQATHTHQCLYIKLFFDFPSNRNFSSVRSLSNHCMLSLLIWYRPQTHKLVMWALWRPTKFPMKVLNPLIQTTL